MDLDDFGGGCTRWLLEELLWDLLFVGTGRLVLLPFGHRRAGRTRLAGLVGLGVWVAVAVVLYLSLA